MTREDILVAFEVATGRKLSKVEKALVEYVCDQVGVPRTPPKE